MSRIGEWLYRRGPAHLVESEIADRLVTRCGRELQATTAKGPMRDADGSTERCKQCLRRPA